MTEDLDAEACGLGGLVAICKISLRMTLAAAGPAVFEKFTARHERLHVAVGHRERP
jgi:hypothetical protein